MAPERFLLVLLLVVAAFAGNGSARQLDSSDVDPILLDDRPIAERHSTTGIDIDLQARVKDIELVDRDGRLYVRPRAHAELVPAETWLRALEEAEADQRAQGFLYVLFNITHPWSFAWIAIGFAGQALFTLRMLLQWYASEKEKRSVIPVGFWWGSLFGGILLFAYFVWRKDIVGILGQSTGIVVYARNLILIHRGAEPARTRPVPANSKA